MDLMRFFNSIFFMSGYLIRRILVLLYRNSIFKLMLAFEVRRFRVFLEENFAGKSVAIVGSAPNIIKRGLGREIDSHDIVVRLNLLSESGREDDLGKKTDCRFIGCTLLNKHRKYIDALAKSRILITTQKNNVFFMSTHWRVFFYNRHIPMHIYPLLRKLTLGQVNVKNETKPPRSGFVFLLLLLKYGKVKNIRLYGFSNNIKEANKVLHYSSGKTAFYDHSVFVNHCDQKLEIDLLLKLQELGFFTISE